LKKVNKNGHRQFANAPPIGRSGSEVNAPPGGGRSGRGLYEVRLLETT